MMSLSEICRMTDGQLIGDDCSVSGISIDSRTLASGDIYIAIAGHRFDGHQFAVNARAAGASALLVSRNLSDVALPQIVVADSTNALAELSSAWRRRFSIPLVGVTGSNGKTTVKEMIAAICQQKHPGLVSERNLNNEIGVPLNLLKLRSGHNWAVIEMGMNHRGEIDSLTKMARPTVALINNASAAHLEGLGSVESVAAAKAEIFHGLADDGTAILNSDDEFYDYWRQLAHDKKTLSFGFAQTADVRVECQCSLRKSDVRLSYENTIIDCRLHLPGQHNARNAAAAAAAAFAVGMESQHVKTGLESVHGIKGRLQILMTQGDCLLLDDSYNANPSSLTAALEVLAMAEGEKVLLLGDMAELGRDTGNYHALAGREAKNLGIDRLFSIGELSASASDAFGEGGRHFESRTHLLNHLRQLPAQRRVILIKGSRSMSMEWFTNRLSVQQPGDTDRRRGCH